MESLRSLYAYWFRYGSPLTLGVFRAVMGVLIFLDLFITSLHRQDWLSENGYIPSWLANKYFNPRVPITDSVSLPRINLFNLNISDSFSYGLLYSMMVLAILVTIGYWTRVTTILLAILMVSLQHRLGPFLNGGDTVLRVSSIYLAIAPCGLAFSMDRILGVKSGRITGPPPLVSLWPQRLIQYNCALIYFTTTWAKWFGVLWKTGAATWYPARLHEFDKFPVPSFMNDFPMVTITTYGTLLVEFALATLVWFKPLRKWVLLSGVGLHLYIEYSMNIPLFAFIMMSLYITFFEGEEIASAWEWVKSKAGRKPIEVTT